MHVSTFILAC